MSGILSSNVIPVVQPVICPLASKVNNSITVDYPLYLHRCTHHALSCFLQPKADFSKRGAHQLRHNAPREHCGDTSTMAAVASAPEPVLREGLIQVGDELLPRGLDPRELCDRVSALTTPHVSSIRRIRTPPPKFFLHPFWFFPSSPSAPAHPSPPAFVSFPCHSPLTRPSISPFMPPSTLVLWL